MTSTLHLFALATLAIQSGSSSQGWFATDGAAVGVRKQPSSSEPFDAPLDPASKTPMHPLRVHDGASPIAPAALDDSPPLPIPAVIVATPEGDRVSQPASGDPYFLGFIAGNYTPPKGERIDPELLASIQPKPRDGRPAPIVYAFAMFERRITPARVATLEALGARVIGYHPNNCLKLAIPVDAFESIAADEDLHWIGTPKRWQKLHPMLVDRVLKSSTTATFDLIVDVYDSDLNAASTAEVVATPSQVDHGIASAVPKNSSSVMTRVHSNGWQERALQNAGLEVREYADSIRAFHARGDAKSLAKLAELDFVQFVEPEFPKSTGHDDSTPLIYSDSTRYYDNGGTSSSVVAGIIDSGFDAAHTDLNHVWGVGWMYGGTVSPWNDVCEHGSHVAGTLLGNGATKSWLRGNAPGLGWGGAGRFFVVKVSDACSGWTTAVSSWVSPLSTSYFDGVSTTPEPMVINNSWGAGTVNGSGTYTGEYTGTEADAITIDQQVYSGQMYDFCAGNDGSSGASTIWLEGCAKNAFTVGSVTKTWTWGSNLPGELSSFSSRGPTKDGRWKPNIVAPGDSILSVDANSSNGYDTKSGTSMATPHVTGVVSQMLDHMSFLKYTPERAASVLMATAMTKGNQVLTAPTDLHLKNYGAGKVEAFKANFGTSQYSWSNWGAYLPANNWTYADFAVGAGCTRLVVCMNYVEPPASSGAAKALVNNFDLFIDQPPVDTVNGNTGDWVAQQSSNDNTEIRILDNPLSGNWRWKIWPTSTTSGVYYGLTVVAIYGDITPDLSVYVTPAKTYLRPGEATNVQVDVFSPTYVASNVVVDADFHFGNGFAVDSWKYLNDGPFDDKGAASQKSSILLGDILHDNWRSATWRTEWFTEGIWGFIANVRGDNVTTQSPMGVVTIDGTPPSAPANLAAIYHTPGTWSNYPFLYAQWSASTDNLSGVAGYSYSVSSGFPQNPDSIIETTLTNGMVQVGSSATGYYFNVGAIDRCANQSATSYTGPFYIDLDAPSALTNLSSNVPVGGTTCGSVSFSWDPASDALSGIAGYSVFIDDQPNTTPSGSIDTTTTSYSIALPTSATAYYAHVTAVDVAGNQGTQLDWGPFYVQAPSVGNFCVAKVDSLGCTPAIDYSGCPSVSSGTMHVTANQILGGTTGRMLWSLTPSPFGGGGSTIGLVGGSRLGTKICLVAPTVTGVQSSGGTLGQCDGTFDFDFGASTMQAYGLAPGMTVYTQYIFDDPNAPDGSKLGQTNGLSFVVAP